MNEDNHNKQLQAWQASFLRPLGMVEIIRTKKIMEVFEYPIVLHKN